MLKLGQYQKLTIVKKVEFGVYLAEEQDMDCLLYTSDAADD